LKGYSVSIDNSKDKFNAKIRNAQIEGFNYTAVIGPAEVEANAITLRKRDEEKFEKLSVAEAFELFDSLKPPKSKRRQNLENKAFKLGQIKEAIKEESKQE